jgi:hypothetical protein
MPLIPMDNIGSRKASNYPPKGYGSSDAWARRFMTAAIVQGAVMVGLTIFLVLGQISIIKPEVSRVIAEGVQVLGLLLVISYT